jgi:hypothetical protein
MIIFSSSFNYRSVTLKVEKKLLKPRIVYQEDHKNNQKGSVFYEYKCAKYDFKTLPIFGVYILYNTNCIHAVYI